MQLLKVVFVWLSLVWSFWSHAAVLQIDRQSPADIVLQNLLSESHQDDLDGMVKRGIIRVLVTFSKTHYYVDKGQCSMVWPMSLLLPLKSSYANASSTRGNPGRTDHSGVAG